MSSALAASHDRGGLEINDRILKLQDALKDHSPEFETLLDTLIDFCNKKKPDVIDVQRSHISFE